MGRISVKKLTAAAFCVALNIIGAYAALLLRLPVYLDSVGTVFASVALGPLYGMAAAALASAISGVTSDVYALYFMPVGLITGLLAGPIFKGGGFRGRKFPLGVLILTLPGTLIGACVAAFGFSGVTSSGSSMLVQLLDHLGVNLVLSVFIVQFFTDYADKLLSAALVFILAARLGALNKEGKNK